MAHSSLRFLNVRRRMALPLVAAFAIGAFVPSSASSRDGMAAIRAAAQLKAQNANEEALQSADKQRDLVKKQKQARAEERDRAKTMREKKRQQPSSMKLR